MSPDLEQQFFARWPEFFRHRLDYRRSMMIVGFECRDGWRDLLWTLFTDVEQVLARQNLSESPGEFKIVQVKEKFGTLRVYRDDSTPEIDHLLDTAMERSCYICEACGLPGVLFIDGGWWATRCASCAVKDGITPPFYDSGTLQIGRFWLVKKRLVMAGTPLANESEVEQHVQHLNDSGAKIGTQIVVPVRSDWADYPRGDIRYDAGTKRPIIYADNCILEVPKLVAEIKDTFNLPLGTEARADDRYCCPKCIGRNAEQER